MSNPSHSIANENKGKTIGASNCNSEDELMPLNARTRSYFSYSFVAVAMEKFSVMSDIRLRPALTVSHSIG